MSIKANNLEGRRMIDSAYNIPKESELRSIFGYKTNLSVINPDSSDRLIVRDECKILVPKT